MRIRIALAVALAIGLVACERIVDLTAMATPNDAPSIDAPKDSVDPDGMVVHDDTGGADHDAGGLDGGLPDA